MAIDVIYEDNHLIAVNKATGDIAQGNKAGDESLPEKIKQWITNKYNKSGDVYLGIIHRLDRPTSGALIFSKTGKALTIMNQLFKNHEVEKIYWAIVENKPKELKGSLIDYLKINKQQNKSYTVAEEVSDAKKAILDYQLLAESDRYFLLEIQLKTGRHHQIRAQLANQGCIIKGDLKYGAKTSNKDGSISLHSRKISFDHPVDKKRVTIIASVPKDNLWEWFDKEVKRLEREI